jgi:predicted nucleic acid-binding Zn ribbon protein
MSDRRDHKLTPLGDLVDAYLDRSRLTPRLDLASAVERWPQLVGDRVAENAVAEAVSADGILWVRVRSSPWAMELSMMAPRLLAILNEGRDGKIRELRCKVGLPDPIRTPPADPEPGAPNE